MLKKDLDERLEVLTVIWAIDIYCNQKIYIGKLYYNEMTARR
jgi:hypothetical protein